jgi:hypothetical protein
LLRSIATLASAASLAALLLVSSPTTARGFQVKPEACEQIPCPPFQHGVHEDITTEALRRQGWSDEAIRQVILGIQGADLFHALAGSYDSRLHFHSNKRQPTPTLGLSRLKLLRDVTIVYDEDDHFTFDGDFALLEELYQRIEDDRDYADGRHRFELSPYAQTDQAFYMFGLILHATQDFYAHTNYLELMSRHQRPRDVAIPERFALDALPEEIESGFACPCDPLRKLPRNVQRIVMEELGLHFLHDDHNYDTPDRPGFEHARRLAVEETIRAAQRFEQVAPRRVWDLLG